MSENQITGFFMPPAGISQAGVSIEGDAQYMTYEPSIQPILISPSQSNLTEIAVPVMAEQEPAHRAETKENY